MKKTFPLLLSAFAVMAPLASDAQTTFFTDNFNKGSTIDSVTPVPPTANSTSYETLSGKSWDPTPSISSQDLNFGIASTGGGTAEIQAMFATNPVVLTAVGTDYIQMVVVFTNTGPLTSGQSYLGFGLYNTGSATNYPVPGGLNGTTTSGFSTNVTGNAQNWQGYMAEIAYEGQGQGDLILTRPQQTTGTLANNDQDLVIKGSSTYAYSFPAGAQIGSEGASISSLVLTNNGTYTEVFLMMLNGADSLAITNTFYSGPNTSGTVLAQFGAVATNATFLTGGFNGLAAGFYQKTSGPSNVLDISSIVISGQSTIVSAPPVITSQPAPVLVATNGSCAFFVTASGFNLTYQWHRHGTNLVDGGNISGSTSDQLVVSPATTIDQLSGNNGYYVTVTGTGDYSTNSLTNSLALITSTNLIWTDNNLNNAWDVNNTVNWQDTNGNPSVFNYGDPVTFNDVAGGGFVNLSNNYLSAASVTVGGTSRYTFQGNGSIAGPGPFWYNGSGELLINANNTYSGGTLISNANAYVYLENYGGLGTGPVTLGEAGGQMEIVPAGGASTGIEGDVVVGDDFTILPDGEGSYGAVFLGDLSGTSGQTLTITPGPGNPDTNQIRIRAYGIATVYNANLDLSDPNILFAPYSASGNQTYNGVISGPGALMEKGTITYFNGANTYSGGTYPAQGAIAVGISSAGTAGSPSSGPIGTGPILLAPDSTTTTTGTGEILASAPNVTIGNAIQYPTATNNQTLEIGGNNNLTFSGPFTLYGNDGTAPTSYTSRIVEVTNTALTTLTGVISDGGSNYGFTVTGTGPLALNNTESYIGPTTNSGVLMVNGKIGSGNVIVTTNGTLGGIGTITGPVIVQSGGTLTAGDEVAVGNQGIGTLTINNTLTFQSGSTNFVEVNKTAGTQDFVTGLTGVTYNGTLVATNLAGTLAAGNSFTIFSATTHSGNFSAVAGSPGPGLGWSFNPTNGVLSVVTSVTVNTNPTNITFSVSSGNLNLSWPADHLGWFLQVQTNSLAQGIRTNWVTVPNSSTVNSTNFPIVQTNGAVFYRLMYP